MINSSPSASPPSLLYSSTASYPSTSSRMSKSRSPPRTPPRGRNRCPGTLTVDPTRVPLHRRGTSRTYERLEDLLKEAGYKETRVFTPEAERREQTEEEQRAGCQGKGSGSVKGGMGVVVDFFAGLVHGPSSGPGKGDGGASQSATGPLHEQEGSQSLPASPLAHKRQLAPDPPLRHSRLGETGLFTTSPPSSASGYESSVSSKGRNSLGAQVHSHLADVHHPGRSQQRRRPGTDQASLRHHTSYPHGHASSARSYLRHMASAPTIAGRESPLHASGPVARRTRTSDNETLETIIPSRPPLPPSWLETVTRAILGAPGAHVGRPAVKTSGSSSPSASRSDGWRTRSSSSRQPPSRDSTVRGYVGRRPTSALSDNTNKYRGHPRGPSSSIQTSHLQPPTLLTNAMRAHTSPGLVVKTQVVCRSAPASRSSSRVGHRLGAGIEDLSLLDEGSVKGKGRAIGRKAGRKGAPRGKGKGRKKERDGGPSLSTRVEEDALGLHRHSDSLDVYYSSSSDDDEGEVDLAKMLVHPKRQQSIQSLRRHLDRSSRSIRGVSGVTKAVVPWLPEDDDLQTNQMQGRSRRGSANDGDWTAIPSFGRDRGTTRRRRGIPNTWA
ncbi:hypothetical protein BV25DRAFT_156260 [Artomyces pyxidatus]|uniref:Uncharacterized protein n=1 Tax=Artomyces pyxidatus TaxID=48021 RepID=A0ACB8TB76_9AGAM|nr:hypothetical protein BV25DRAFT_156260 [Artomyces pyxidatus]